MDPPDTKLLSFACERCRAGKRKCDAAKPQCSLCHRLGKSCVYAAEKRPRKRKYWDEEYVHGLEQQIQTLMAALDSKSEGEVGNYAQNQEASVSTENPVVGLMNEHNLEFVQKYTTENPTQHTDISMRGSTGNHDRSMAAMEELSVMMWRTNLGDGATITNDEDGHHCHRHEGSTSWVSPPADILEFARDSSLLSRIASAFLNHINPLHQFTNYQSPSFLTNYPYQTLDKTFLHTALLSVGAAILAGPEPAMLVVSDKFARYAETLIFDCCRARPTISIIQGISMLSHRSLSLGMDHVAWTFTSMAGGLCVQLRLHALAVEQFPARSPQPNSEDIRTFWMYYFINRSAVSILGRDCALPWRKVDVPALDTTFGQFSTNVAELSFAWQCRLWYAHDATMDEIFSPAFERRPLSQQIRHLVSTIDQLHTFFRARPSGLDMTHDAPKSVFHFHLQFHMAILVIISPFLRHFAGTQANIGTEAPDSNKIFLVLRSITTAATETIRLIRSYRGVHSLTNAPPIIVHHLLSAALVHLMNATSNSESLKRQSARWLRLDLEMFRQMQGVWLQRAQKSIKMIQALAKKWGVLHSLPLEYLGSTTSRQLSDDDQVLQPSFAMSNQGQPFLGLEAELRTDPFLSWPFITQPGEEASASALLQTFEEIPDPSALDFLFKDIE